MLIRHAHNPILKKNPSVSWEAGSVLNPSVFYEDGLYRMVYRATNDIRRNVPGGYISSLGYAESADGVHFTRGETPLLSPSEPYESLLGTEDPRVVKMGDTYYLFYTAVGGTLGNPAVRIALATSHDFKNWEKQGIIGPREVNSKAAVFFPEPVAGKYLFLYTLLPDTPMSTIMLAELEAPAFHRESMAFTQDFPLFPPPARTFRGAEVGAAPIKTDAGWLFIYCPANTSDHAEWTINAALVDLQDPRRLLADLELMRPETTEEVSGGVVQHVTFPESAVVVGSELYVYYGAGDQGICLATCSLPLLLERLKSSSTRSST